jgi:AcrR family transcriptional regulator
LPPRPNASSDEILITTIQLIAQHDVLGVTVDMVAEKAGVGKTTIYRRWPSREDLIFEALSYIDYPEADPDTGSLREDLTVLLKSLVHFLNRPEGGGVYAAFLNAAMRDSKLASLREKVSRKARVDYERAIARGIARGELVPDVNVRLMIDVLIAPFIYRRIGDNVNARQSDVRRIIDVAMAAFGTGTPTSRRSLAALEEN